MDCEAIELFYKNTKDLLNFLEETKQPSFAVEVDNNFKKVLLLSAASFFEKWTTETLMKYALEKSGGDERLMHFLKQRAIGDKYFQLFDWKDGNIYLFFSHFGKDFKKSIEPQINTNKPVEEGAKAFLEIGSWRNQLVHQNYAEFTLPKTSEEIYGLYKKAIIFLQFIESVFITPNAPAGGIA